MASRRILIATILIVIIIVGVNFYRYGLSSNNCVTDYEDSNLFHDAFIDTNGNTIVVGEDYLDRMPKTWYVGVDKGDQSINILVVKFDNLGNLVYSIAIGGSDRDITKRAVLDKEDNLILAGETYSPEFLGQSISEGSRSFLLKLSPEGVVIWIKLFSKDVAIHDLVLTSDNQVYITGDHGLHLLAYNRTAIFGAPENYSTKIAYILKIRTNGTIADYIIFHGRDTSGYKIASDTYGGLFVHIFTTGNTFLDHQAPIIDNSIENFSLLVKMNHSYGLEWIIQVDFYETLKVLEHVDNSTYLWFAHHDSIENYDYLQRLDGSGNEIWNIRHQEYFGLPPTILRINLELYITLDEKIYRVNEQTMDFEEILTYDSSTIFGIASEMKQNRLVVFGESYNNELLTETTYQDEIIGQSDLFIIMSTNEFQSLWSTYFGGDVYEVGICIE